VPAWSALLAVAILGPALGPGHVLSYDMVFTPRPPLSWRAAGLGDALPRAVPQDLVVALLARVVPGSLVQAAALVGAVFFAAWGAGLLVPTRRTGLRLAAASLYGWNAFVAERLFIGHWGLLVAYAALPWVVRASLALRAGHGGAAGVVLAAAPAALTPTGSLFALGIAAAVLLAPGPVARRRWVALAGAAALMLPWVVAGIASTAGGRSDPAGVAAFAVRSEGPGGVPGTLAGLGGIWNAATVPASRATVVALVAAVLVLGLAAAGGRVLRARWPAGGAAGLAGAAAVGVLIAAAGAVPGADAVVRALVSAVPGGGLLRDGHKFLAPLALLLAVAAPLGVERAVVLLRRRVAAGSGTRLVVAALGVAAVVLPIAALPDLAWGGLGRLRAGEYPADWDAVAARVDGRGGTLVTLPFGAFRAYGWNGGRISLDPADRYLDVPVVVDDALVVDAAGGRTTVDGEDRHAAEVRRVLAAGRPLTAAGVRWALVETDQPGRVPAGVLAGMRPMWTGPTLTLYESTATVRAAAPPAWERRLAVALGHLGLLATVVTAMAAKVTTVTRRRC
jgi:hypothetical protein